MKKIFVAVMALFVMVSCGGAKEEDIEIHKEFADKLEVAVDERDEAAVVDAVEWLVDEARDYRKKYDDLLDEERDVRRKIQRLSKEMDEKDMEFTKSQERRINELLEELDELGMGY